MMIIEYSGNARNKIEDYLNAVRDRLAASESVDAREVVEDLRGHIERELSGAGRPVSEADVEKVLHRLGLPEQVVDEADMSWWRKMILRLRTGPEDWRLAYLSLGVLFVGLPLGVIPSFLLSRAALSIAKEPDPPAKKWLIYPSLIVVYAIIGAVGLLWPVFAVGGLVAGLSHGPGSLLHKEPFFDKDGLGTVLAILAGGGLGLSVWWSLLWAVGRRRPAIFRVTFRPFADDWTGRTFGKAVLTVWAMTLALAAAAALLWVKT
jgi:hypothetical protein